MCTPAVDSPRAGSWAERTPGCTMWTGGGVYEGAARPWQAGEAPSKLKPHTTGDTARTSQASEDEAGARRRPRRPCSTALFETADAQGCQPATAAAQRAAVAPPEARARSCRPVSAVMKAAWGVPRDRLSSGGSCRCRLVRWRRERSVAACACSRSCKQQSGVRQAALWGRAVHSVQGKLAASTACPPPPSLCGLLGLPREAASRPALSPAPSTAALAAGAGCRQRPAGLPTRRPRPRTPLPVRLQDGCNGGVGEG